MKIAVIGAGPGGLTAATQLAKAGAKVELFEAGPSVGGMCRTFPLWNQRVDLGPHRFFTKNKQVNDFWFSLASDHYTVINRLTRILFRGQLIQYPLSAFDVFMKLGVFESALCTGSYVIRDRSIPEQDNFETWVCRRFGRRLYEHFFQSYSEKLWGIPCAELDSDFAKQRIKNFSLGEGIKNALKLQKKGKHHTLLDQFPYPTLGTGSIYEAMVRMFIEAGGILHLGQKIDGILTSKGKITGLKAGDRNLKFDSIVSTMPLTHLVSGIPETPTSVLSEAAKLKFRNTILVYLKVASTKTFPDNWVYVHSPELKTGRITNFRNWSPQMTGGMPETILALEYWAKEDDEVWRSADSKLVDLAAREISSTRLVSTESVLDGHVVRVPRCYPIYSAGYKKTLEPVTSYLKTFPNLYPIGRYGSFKYNNQDHSIFMGLMAAKAILEKRPAPELWDCNTDDEYQETGSADEVASAPSRKQAA